MYTSVKYRMSGGYICFEVVIALKDAWLMEALSSDDTDVSEEGKGEGTRACFSTFSWRKNRGKKTKEKTKRGNSSQRFFFYKGHFLTHRFMNQGHAECSG